MQKKKIVEIFLRQSVKLTESANGKVDEMIENPSAFFYKLSKGAVESFIKYLIRKGFAFSGDPLLQHLIDIEITNISALMEQKIPINQYLNKLDSTLKPYALKFGDKLGYLKVMLAYTKLLEYEFYEANFLKSLESEEGNIDQLLSHAGILLNRVEETILKLSPELLLSLANCEKDEDAVEVWKKHIENCENDEAYF